MTIEQRLEQVEQQNQKMQRQNQKIQRTNKRLTVAMTAATLGRSISGRQLPLPEEHL